MLNENQESVLLKLLKEEMENVKPDDDIDTLQYKIWDFCEENGLSIEDIMNYVEEKGEFMTNKAMLMKVIGI